MELKPFTIVALPFAYSSITSDFTEYGTDEQDALQTFKAKYPLFGVKEVKAQ